MKVLFKYYYFKFLWVFSLLFLLSLKYCGNCTYGISFGDNLISKDTISKEDLGLMVVEKKNVLPTQVVMSGFSQVSELDSISVLAERMNLLSDLLDKSDYSAAYAVLQNAYSVCPSRLKDKKVLLDILHARIRLNFYNDNQTIDLLNRTDSIVKTLDNDSLLALHLNNLGVYYYKWTKDAKRKDICFDYALKLNKKLGVKREIARILNNMGVACDNSDKAISYLKKAIVINTSLNNKVLLAINYSNIALKYIDIENKKLALESLLLAEEIINESDLKQIAFILYKNKAEVYEKIGRSREAYRLLKKALLLKKESFHENYILNLERELIQNSLFKKELQMKIRESEYHLKMLNRSVIFTVFIIFILIIVVFLLVGRHRNMHKIQELNTENKLKEQELKYNKKELINIATFLKSRHRILENIDAKIGRLQKKDELTEFDLRNLNLYVKSLMNKKDGSMDEAQRRVDEINKEFLERLENLHPGLTKNDKKLASLLRANFTTKQIAAVLNTYPSSVNVARHRMRQHMNLDNGVNLVSYIRNI